ncbi:MAG: hypothetical protein K2G60_01540 [Oscillospiraceae bacterium]|nr:hypothetical protein [Oscillospiraceae bacterium]
MSEEYNNMQENDVQADSSHKRCHFLTKGKIVLSIVAVLIFGVVWDIFIDPPAWWRFERQQDKKAILEYVESNYPDTIKRKGGEFPLQMPAGPHKNSVMYFELDGINFQISAEYGEIRSDTYYEAKAEKYIRENYIDDFMNQRGLSPQIKIFFFGGINEDIRDFKGHISVKIVQGYVDGASTPKQIDWFYDFYQYWIEYCDLPNCAVTLTYHPPKEFNPDIWSYNMWFQKEKKTFANKGDFYADFTA